MNELAYILEKYGVMQLPRHNAPVYLPITRDELAVLFYELGYMRGAEIGVAEGFYSEIICKANPKLKALYCIDAWKPYRGYNDHKSYKKLERFYKEAQERLAPYKCEIFRKFSMEVVGSFFDRSIDFVYIDAAHDFLSVTQDIAAWSPKVRSGGIVAGHDFRRDKNPNWAYAVKDVVPSWIFAHRISPWFVTTEQTPSWFWVVA